MRGNSALLCKHWGGDECKFTVSRYFGLVPALLLGLAVTINMHPLYALVGDIPRNEVSLSRNSLAPKGENAGTKARTLGCRNWGGNVHRNPGT